jgi:glyoxylase-like metal-dependent hydrolase (beta-lactamase superfamily II)
MKVHHINLGTMCPLAPRAWISDPTDAGGGRLVCHGLLVELDEGLLLIETGLGSNDLARPTQTLGRGFVAMTRPTFEPELMAISHVERLGFKREDVRHIVCTHMDLDHAGGLPDFPEAKVHVYARELEAVQARATFAERERYRPAHFAHGPRWESYEVQGEAWHGFDCVRQLRGLPPEVLLVPLVGHTRGHCAVALDLGERWLVHAGDAYFFRGEMDPERPTCPPALRIFQERMGVDRWEMTRNKERLRLLAKEHAGDFRVFSAHDPIELDRAQGRA